MATECTQEAVLQFLTERGGRVKNLELIDYFKSIFPSNPEKRTAVRECFKEHVDNIAFVKIENGVKFVCLKKKYRSSVKFVEKDSRNGIHVGVTSVSEQKKITLRNESLRSNLGTSNSSVNTAMSVLSCGKVRSFETAVNDAAQQEILPGSGYGTDNTGEEHPYVPEIFVQRQSREGVVLTRSFGHTIEGIAFDMGNKIIKDDKKASAKAVDVRMLPPEIPQISVIEASPLPAPGDGSMFTMPGQSRETTLGQVDKWGLHTTRHSGTHPKHDESLCIAQGGKDANVGRTEIVTKRRTSRESQRSLMSSHPSEDGTDEVQMDSLSLSGSESNTPKGSRKNFIELMMNSSPHVRRSMALRNSVYLSARYNDCSRSDSDSASVVSSTTEDEATPVTLDPLEHEWMMCSSDGQWDSLHELLACEPNLILKKDFVTGFTCLHWAAKQGKPELLALIVNFAKKHTVPININTKSSAGYTPLHLAAMHNHVEVVKLLIGAYDADVEARDYNGKKACQYLTNSVAVDIRDIIGACGDSESENKDHMDGVRWRLSKVLQSSLMPLKLLNHSENDSGDGLSQEKPKLLRRKSSLSSIRPKLQRIRFRSQIVHSTSFNEGKELEGSLRGSVKSRSKTTVFG
ncbi:ankyrin repeat domain-containing protein SOWAHC-like [Osmerus mordax]|uniref:ankyrin repeat domain-containing protein SOWAHC-like n=1 Tax=Osmerus mordax TaxID=8014 RepID=UPI00350FC980